MIPRYSCLCKKFVAASLSIAILTISPGFEGYQLFAQVHVQPVQTGMVLPGGQIGAAIPMGGIQSNIRLDSFNPNLKTSIIPGVQTPTVSNVSKDLIVPKAVSVSNQPHVVGSIRPELGRSDVRDVKAVVTAPTVQSQAPSFKTLASDQRSVALPAEEISRMPQGQAREAGAAMMDNILGVKSIQASAEVEAPVPGVDSSQANGLQPAEVRSIESAPSIEKISVLAQDAKPQSSLSRPVRAAVSIARMAAAAAAVVGLQAAAVALLPAVFGLAPVAALWAISSGALLLPVAVYSRYRLGLRDSPRLAGVKLALDLFIGAFVGAVAVTAPAFLGAAAISHLAIALPFVSLASFAAARAGQKGEGAAGGLIDKLLAWASLTLIAPLIGVAGAAPLTLASIVGLMALPAMTTVSFFLGYLIRSAETGRPFQVPGGLQPLRFPLYTWVLTGVVFALLTGYAPVWVNAAFGVWMFTGKSKIFNWLYGGLAVWAAATGFAAPVTFLLLAFAPERAAVWTEALLGKLFPARQAAPSSTAPQEEQPEPSKPSRWPAFHYWMRTGLAFGGLVALSAAMTAAVFTFTSFLGNLAFIGVITGLQVVFSRQLIKKVMKTEPTDAQNDPEVFSIMTELRDIINRGLAARGKKPIPMPEIINVNMGVPNAFATGMSPHKAMVGVTYEIKQMLLEPENLRTGLMRLMGLSDPAGKPFAVFRSAIRGSIPGVSENASPAELQEALHKASAAELKALGYRALRGVLGHEFSHVMNRDMIIGASAGALSSAIAFASYGVLWAVGHAKAAIKKLKEILLDRPLKPAKKDVLRGRDQASVKPEAVVEPVTVGAAVQSALGLLRIFAALWGPIIATILQMASSRVREGAADEDGALLTMDPAALALGLGLLTTWQPPSGFVLAKEDLPRLASQAHLMTVNPIEQLYRAGALPEFDLLTRMAVGKEDSFFFNLFITHPDTTLRIQRLHDMQKAVEAGAKK